MPLYMVTVQPICRSKGQSAVAAAAYRTGSKLKDDRLGVTYDYTQKQHVAWSMILAPESAPSWVWNRQELWNRVESAEHRKDSQVAREFLVALPRELTLEQNIDLIMGFSAEQLVNRGMVADIGIHAPTGNPHAHILLTMRELQGDDFGLKNREWNNKPVLYQMRQAWERHCNAALEAAGVVERVDCRSLEAQGIDRIPQIHLGSHAAKCLENGTSHPRVERYLEIERQNAELAKLQQEKKAVEVQIEETKRQEWAETILPIASEYLNQQVQSSRTLAGLTRGWNTQWEGYRIVERHRGLNPDWELEIYSSSGNSIAKYSEQQGQGRYEARPEISSDDAQRFLMLQRQMEAQAQQAAEQKQREEQRERERQEQERQRLEELQRQQAQQEQERLERERLLQQQQAEAERLAKFQQQQDQWIDEIVPTAIESMCWNKRNQNHVRPINESQDEISGSAYWAIWSHETRELDYYRRADGQRLFTATREAHEDSWTFQQISDLTQADLDFHRQTATKLVELYEAIKVETNEVEEAEEEERDR